MYRKKNTLFGAPSISEYDMKSFQNYKENLINYNQNYTNFFVFQYIWLLLEL